MKNNLIYSHEDGLTKMSNLKKTFEIELEINCLNSTFYEITDQLESAKNLALKFPNQCVLKESEFHEDDVPYYEISLFCNRNDINEKIKTIESFNLIIDIIHEIN
jgi:hypothetical protein